MKRGLFALLITANLAAWAWAGAAFHGAPTLLAAALLAWVFGLRHALDGDHISAIDNVVRKLMQNGARPATVGLWFSLGHSTIVVLASLAIVTTAAAMQGRLQAVKDIGGAAGTLISAIFLLTIAASNLVILRDVWNRFRCVRNGGVHDHGIDMAHPGLPFLIRLFRPLFRVITRGWHMYPLGVLFGLGFDTATEIGLLGISATQASRGMSPWQAMVFPALFTASMALVDTADSALMVHAYGWAFVNPLRKLWYNLTITAASVLVAVLIGGIEVLGLVRDRLVLGGPFWHTVGRLNDSPGTLGAAVVGIFVLCWISSVAVYCWKVRDELTTSAAALRR